MKKFMKGKQLSEMFFSEVVKEILKSNFPDLKYSAGLIGYGSEVLGFDTERSTDHHWGPRVMLFLEEKDFNKKEKISEFLSKKLPTHFKGYSTNFSDANDNGVQLLDKVEKGELINHRVEIFTIKSFFNEYLNIDINKKITVFDWLTFSEQKLRTIKDGKIFYDKIGFKQVKNKFNYYPKDVWLYLLTSEWAKIAEEEAFIGRCGEMEDELGSKIIAMRLVQSIVRLCFLMEKQYTPYSKWFGTAFRKLKSSKKLGNILDKISLSNNWKQTEKYLSKAYEIIANMHNELQITKSIPAKVTEYFDRPFLVINAWNFVEEIKKQIKAKDILNINAEIGSVNQITNSFVLLENNELLQKMSNLYK